jgi:uncharacterized protein (TIGR00255 family)
MISMFKSMTGFGISKGNEEGYSITVEIRTLNSKFLDAGVRLPKIIQDKELEIRNTLSTALVRGKVSLFVELKKEEGEISEKIGVNKALFEAYYNEFNQLAETVKAPKDDLFKLALYSPEVLNADTSNGENDLEWKLVKKHINLCADHCNEFRAAEGLTLKKELNNYIQNIDDYLEQIVLIDPERTVGVKERILGHIKEVSEKEDYDQNRYEQEMIYYIEKLDISEEIVRLGSHLEYFKETMELPDAQGKKLGFISQEIGREINTIGSKANFAEMQRHVVCMKDELEKIKEQLLNVL